MHWGSYAPQSRQLWSLLEDVRVEVGPEEQLYVRGRWGGVEVTDRSPVVREALSRMSLGPVSLENISALYGNFMLWRQGLAEPCDEWDRLQLALGSLGGYVVPSLGHEDASGPLLSVVAQTPDAVFALPALREDEPIHLRPWATIQVLQGEPALVCPGAPYRVVLHRTTARAIGETLLRICMSSIPQLSAILGLDRRLVADIVAYLIGAGVVFSVHSDT
jgi:hypothetical protein